MRQIAFFLFFTLLLSCSPRMAPYHTPPRTDWWLWTAAWRPQHDVIAVGGTQDTLRLLSANKVAQISTHPMPGTITQLDWHPTAPLLAIAMQGGKSTSSVLNIETGIRTALDSLNEFGARSIDWNHDGSLVAVGDYDGFLLIYDTKGKLIKKISTLQKSIIGLDWHPRMNTLVAVGDRITLFDFATGEMLHVEDRKEEVLMLCVAWHPSGKFFATGDYGDTEKQYAPLLQYWSSEGENMQTLQGSKAEYRKIAWSPDGKHLATASDKLRLWDATGKRTAERSVPALLWGLDWNSAGDTLATTDFHGSVQVWDRRLRLAESRVF